MKIKFSNGIGGESFSIEVNEDEEGREGIMLLAEVFQEQMVHAYEAAHTVWERFPEFRQVTLDTLTDSEHIMINRMRSVKNKTN